MFTGIIEELGTVITAGTRLSVRCSTVLSDAVMGASIAVNGVCLTAAELRPDSFAADLAPETLKRSNLGDLRPGSRVNLERPLSPDRAAERPHRARPRGRHRRIPCPGFAGRGQLVAAHPHPRRTGSLPGVQRLHRHRRHQPDDRRDRKRRAQRDHHSRTRSATPRWADTAPARASIWSATSSPSTWRNCCAGWI